jgi:hypothetical protein
LKLIDLSGQALGSLTVLYRGPNGHNGHARWFARCGLCGSIQLYNGYSLTRKGGGIVNCGCTRDLTKEDLGRLRALRPGPLRKYGKELRTTWWCRCECGTEKLFTTQMLTRSWNPVRACGCQKGRFHAVQFQIGEVVSASNLRILGEARSRGHERYYHVQCLRCGKITEKKARRIGLSIVSCGCKLDEHKKILVERSRKHGQAPRGHNNRLYNAWVSARQRCLNPRHPRYHQYGGKGIAFCTAWENFRVFETYVLIELGPRPPFSAFGRIDPSGDYVPGNIAWVPGTRP